jgi:serine/threonine protein kinase
MVERIGHYRIVSELGRGGMGVVYKAHEESLNRFVALKVLGEHLSEDSDYVQRFVREAQSAATLTHPNIVQVYAISEDQGKHFFAMEYVHGTSIQKLLKVGGPMDPMVAASLIIQAASGLDAAHEIDIVHRDIKPANLMVSDKGLVKIADFGLALLMGNASRLTATGMFMGTPGYLSPEQCMEKSPDHRTDIYSLGVTFYEMLTGVQPYTATSPLALIRQIMEATPAIWPNSPRPYRPRCATSSGG